MSNSEELCRIELVKIFSLFGEFHEIQGTTWYFNHYENYKWICNICCKSISRSSYLDLINDVHDHLYFDHIIKKLNPPRYYILPQTYGIIYHSTGSYRFIRRAFINSAIAITADRDNEEIRSIDRKLTELSKHNKTISIKKFFSITCKIVLPICVFCEKQYSHEPNHKMIKEHIISCSAIPLMARRN